MTTCSNCRFWSRDSDARPECLSARFGSCSSPKFKTNENSADRDGFFVGDQLGEVEWYTGQDFSCLHWEVRIEPPPPQLDARLELVQTLDTVIDNLKDSHLMKPEIVQHRINTVLRLAHEIRNQYLVSGLPK